jgi:hypothetical protein
MNVVRATNGSPVFQGKMNELPDIYNLRINNNSAAVANAQNVAGWRKLVDRLFLGLYGRFWQFAARGF